MFCSFFQYIFLTKLLTIWLYLCLWAGLHVIDWNTKHYRHGMWAPEFKFFKNNFRNSSSSVFTFVGKSIIKLLVLWYLWWSCNKLSLSSRKHSAQRIYHFNLLTIHLYAAHILQAISLTSSFVVTCICDISKKPLPWLRGNTGGKLVGVWGSGSLLVNEACSNEEFIFFKRSAKMLIVIQNESL